jgi:hypothetical protein
VQFLAAAGLVMFLTGISAYYATGRELNVFFLANVIVGPALVAVAGVVQARRFRGFSGALSRRVVLRWSAILLATLALFFAVDRASRGWALTLDWSLDREYTLSDQSHRVCAELDRGSGPPIELLFFEDTKLSGQVEPLVQAYRDACPRLRIRSVSERDAPAAAHEILNRFETTVVGCLGDRCEPVGFPSEGNITNAVLRLARQQQLVAYFLLGHGEANLASEADHGFSGLAGVLQAEGIQTRGWVGPAHGEMPDGASVLIIAAPERDLLPAELEGLERYLSEGGRLLALLEPRTRTNLDELLERWGFALPPGIVVDMATSPLLEEPRPVSLLVNSWGTHPVTGPFGYRTMTLLPGARVVTPHRKPQPDDRLVPLAFSSRRSWLESDVEEALAERTIEPDPDEMANRDLPIASAGRFPRGEREARIVVIGDADFASNRLLGALYNRDLLLNSVLWLVEDERRISIRQKAWTPFQHPLTVQQTLAYFYFLAFALPEVLLLLGIRAWYRQRQ